MAAVAQVVIDGATPQFDKCYSYEIPPDMPALPGCRVTVPFGKGNRTKLGFVLSVADEAPAGQPLKRIASLVDGEPLLQGDLLRLVSWMHDYTFCGYYDAVRALLPPGIGVKLRYTYLPAHDSEPDSGALSDSERQVFDYLHGRTKPVKEETLCAALGLAPDAPVLAALCARGLIIKSQEVHRRVLDEKVVMVRLSQEIQSLSDVQAKLTPKQRGVVELLLEVGQASLKEVCYFAAVGKTVVDRLEKSGVCYYFTREVYRNPYQNKTQRDSAESIVLSREQTAAFEGLRQLADADGPAAALLYGVTGSGKTEVFLRVIDHVLRRGKSVIVMVPEIALTPQTIERFHRYFGARVAVLHSGLSMGERADEYKRIKRGKADIVVGTRSAVFAPLEKIGLIVMDEEQESSYKSEKSPRYHARDVAKVRAAAHGALLLLSSATPSVDSFWRAKQGKYHLFTLAERYGNALLPDVTILDMSTQPATGEHTSLSGMLVDELRENLARGEQSILLLNRRGYNTLVKCGVCGTAASCPHCSVALTYHHANGQLMCHYCGYRTPADAACPTCQSKFLRFRGAGTQRVEEELSALFPEARILRMDLDTTMSRFSHERYFADISAGRYDIIIGTQMVAKGLDFPKVTLVGILSADASLYAQNYCSFERAFSLFTQVVGRSGRADRPGRAYIQTFTPENPVIELAAKQDYDGFYETEIESRRIHLYPPFCDMAGIGFSGADNLAVRDAAAQFLAQLQSLAKSEYNDIPLRVLGPCESQIHKIAGHFRWRIAVKCNYNAKTRQFLHRLAGWFLQQPFARQVTLTVDPRYEDSV